MITSRDEDSAATGERSVLGPYLQIVAAALAAPDATVESVLRAARARGARRVVSFVRFTVPDPRVIDASIQVGDASDPSRHPESVELRFDRQGAPAMLAELEPSFGAWTDDVAGVSVGDPYQIDFTTLYPPHLRGARPGGPLAAVRVSLSGEPRTPGVRIRRVLLRRFVVNP